MAPANLMLGTDIDHVMRLSNIKAWKLPSKDLAVLVKSVVNGAD